VKKNKIILASISFVFISLFLILLALRMSNFFSFFFENTMILKNFQIINFIVMLIIMTISSIIGFIVSKKKGRNKCLWSILCFLFNFWALIILHYTPLSDNR